MSKLGYRAVRADEIRPGARLWLMGNTPIWVKVEAVLEGLKALVSWTQQFPEGDLQPMRATVPLGDLAVQLGTEGDPLAPTKRPEADRPATQLVYPPGISSAEFGDLSPPPSPTPAAMLRDADMSADSAHFVLTLPTCPLNDDEDYEGTRCLSGPHSDGTVVQSQCEACAFYLGHIKSPSVVLPGLLIPARYSVACAYAGGKGTPIPKPEDR